MEKTTKNLKCVLPENDEHLDRAMQAAKQAKTLDELRRALAVTLTKKHGLTLQSTAQAIGRSTSWVAEARDNFIEFGITARTNSHGGRRNQIVNEADEAELMEQVCKKYRQLGNIAHLRTDLTRKDLRLEYILRRALAERAGHPVALSTAYAWACPNFCVNGSDFN